MYSYELTERGKIIIAIVIVLLLLVVPSIVLAVNAWNNATPPEEPPRTTVPEQGETPAITDRPLPDSSGLEPDDTSEVDDSEPAPIDPPQVPDEDLEEPDEIPESGFVSLDRTRGTMKFTFSPDHQESLDTDTISALADFVTSPRNTARAQISIETPSLSNEDSVIFRAAITEALAQHGVKTDNLVYTSYGSTAYERTFEVMLSFQQPTNRK